MFEITPINRCKQGGLSQERFPYPTTRCTVYSVYDEVYWLSLKHNPFNEQNASIVVFGTEKSFDGVLSGFLRPRRSAQEIQSAAVELDVLHWLEDEAAEEPEYYEFARGEWPRDMQRQGPCMRKELLADNQNQEVIIGVLPVWDRWKIPCLLNYGNWNACPPPEVHAALWKRWSEMYGAEPSWIGHGELEFSVRKPVSGKDEALALAREQSLYCPDLVHQTYGTLDDLAASLMGAQDWGFWWD
jgi:hypothetical protein